MRYWLMKTEPETFSWDDLVARGEKGEEWDGVRNYQARNFMREMALGDQVFIYHSGAERAIVGIAEICATAHPDSTSDDPRWEAVDLRALGPLDRPVTLDACKARPDLADMALVTRARLSVQPVSAEAWAIICAMGGAGG